MKYKLIASDMDGTLLNDQSLITERTKTALMAAVDAGVIFVPSTGRPMCGMGDIDALFTEDLPFVVFNGAMAVMGKSGRVLFSQPLGFDYIKEIYSEGVGRGLPVILWTEKELFVSIDNDATMDYRGITGAGAKLIEDIEQFRESHVCKMIWIDTPAGAARGQAEMGARFGGRVNCHTSRPYLLEFVDEGASKALALRAVGKEYGIDRSEMIAVGDGYNDVSMLQYVGLGVAVDNAPDDVKRLCKEVTLSNNDDGVAAVIDRWILGA